MQSKLIKYSLVVALLAFCSCDRSARQDSDKAVYKGLYSFGPEVTSFKNCDDTHEYWVTDSSAQLELKYSQMNFEKPYEPVYVEVEGNKVKSGDEGKGAGFDSTLIVKKVIKITREIPQDMCN